MTPPQEQELLDRLNKLIVDQRGFQINWFTERDKISQHFERTKTELEELWFRLNAQIGAVAEASGAEPNSEKPRPKPSYVELSIKLPPGIELVDQSGKVWRVTQ